MRILYIKRARYPMKRAKRVRVALTGLTEGQEGFFEAALYEAGKIKSVYLDELCEVHGRFDALVVNARCGMDWQMLSLDLLENLKRFDCPRGLFLHMAHPEVMPGDDVLDAFDTIFKREPYADLERYAISEANRAKIVPTHLSNPFLKTSRLFPRRNINRPLARYAWQTEDAYEVSFLGSLGGNKIKERQEVWQRVLDEKFNAFGGLIKMHNYRIPDHLAATKLGKPEYMAKIMQTSVNLALNGHGPFTYRHLELLWAGAFLLSHGDIRDQWLRAPLVENQDYVAFDDLDEMVDKIRYYLDHPEERLVIAQNGRSAYERLHDVGAHAVEIRQALGG